jgi:hypothetical protein
LFALIPISVHNLRECRIQTHLSDLLGKVV